MNSAGTVGAEFGIAVAIDGDTAVVGQNCEAVFYGLSSCSTPLGVYVFQKQPAGWVSETQTAVLTSSSADIDFGLHVGISGDTVVVSGKDKAYVFVKPADGWANMTETAQLAIPTGEPNHYGPLVAISGDTIVAGATSSVYVFTKPSTGWVTTAAYKTELNDSDQQNLSALAIDGDTIVAGHNRAYYPENGAGYVDVFSKPATGWADYGGGPTTKLLHANGIDGDGFGSSLAISGDTIAVGTTFASPQPYGQGAVDLFVEPASGWANATQSAEVFSPDVLLRGIASFGIAVALDDRHLVVGSDSDAAYIFSKPAGGWGSPARPSEEYFGSTNGFNVGFSRSVGVTGASFIAGAPYGYSDGRDAPSSAYVFTLIQNWIHVSSDFLQFPEIDVNGSTVLPLTITNTSAATQTFLSQINAPNYKVLETAENTCMGSVPAGQSCVLPIEFNPPGVGIHTNLLRLSSPDSASVRFIDLRGTATGVGAASESLDFGDVPYTSTRIESLLVTNFGIAGSPKVTATSNLPQFTVIPGSCENKGVAIGKTCNIRIQFYSGTRGIYKGLITLTPASGPPSTVKVSAFSS